MMDTRPRYTGMLGMHGKRKATNLGVTRCDLLIVVGAQVELDRAHWLDDSANLLRDAKIIHIDVDAGPRKLNKKVALLTWELLEMLSVFKGALN